MNRWIRGLTATLAVTALLLTHAAPAAAVTKDFEDHGRVNIIFDAVVLRPMGLAMTAVGAMIFAFPVGPIVGLTRPKDIGKPLDGFANRLGSCFGVVQANGGSVTMGKRRYNMHHVAWQFNEHRSLEAIAGIEHTINFGKRGQRIAQLRSGNREFLEDLDLSAKVANHVM